MIEDVDSSEKSTLLNSMKGKKFLIPKNFGWTKGNILK